MKLKRAKSNETLVGGYTREIYDDHLRRLPNNKAAGPDGIPNEILKMMPEAFHDVMHAFLAHIGRSGKTPASWKASHTILLYKKGDPLMVKNYRPIALANTMYKLWTSIVTTLMSDFAEEHSILHEGQEGFRRHRNTERQIQMLLGVLEDAKLTKQDIYLLYVDFTNAFGSVDHPRMIALLEDLGFPSDCVNIVGNLYTGARTAFITPAGLTGEIPIGRGNIQGDTLSPLMSCAS